MEQRKAGQTHDRAETVFNLASQDFFRVKPFFREARRAVQEDRRVDRLRVLRRQENQVGGAVGPPQGVDLLEPEVTAQGVEPLFFPVWRLHFREPGRSGLRVLTLEALSGHEVEW